MLSTKMCGKPVEESWVLNEHVLKISFAVKVLIGTFFILFSVVSLISGNHTIMWSQQRNLLAIPWYQTQSMHQTVQ
jgi:hypothetical protein